MRRLSSVQVMTQSPLVNVLGTTINDGVIRVEKLACGHLTSRLSTERNAKRRRCAKCSLGLAREWEASR